MLYVERKTTELCQSFNIRVIRLNEKVVYTADFISAERDYSDVDIMRGLAALSLDKAMEYALRFTIPDLIKKRRTVHPDSVALYNELVLINGGFYDT